MNRSLKVIIDVQSNVCLIIKNFSAQELQLEVDVYEDVKIVLCCPPNHHILSKQMLSRLSVMDLAGIAGAVGIVGAATCLYAVRKKTNSIMNENYSVSAYKLVQQNRAVMEMIGDPLRTRRLDLTDTINNKFEELSTRVKLPFKGSKRNGNLYVWADRQHSDHEWTVKRLEIIFSDIPDKKVIVYKNESDR